MKKDAKSSFSEHLQNRKPTYHLHDNACFWDLENKPGLAWNGKRVHEGAWASVRITSRLFAPGKRNKTFLTMFQRKINRAASVRRRRARTLAYSFSRALRALLQRFELGARKEHSEPRYHEISGNNMQYQEIS